MFAPRLFRLLNRNAPDRRNRPALPFLLLALFLLACNGAEAQPAAKVLRLGKIEVNGLERYTKEQVVSESGLQLGQPIDIQAADEAATRLMSSGLFKKLSFRFRSAKDQATITFEVEEVKATVPVVFDNFVWFSEQELLEAIRREVPSFDGTAPETGEMPDNIKRALQGLLNARKIQGHVEYLSAAGATGKNSRYIFNVKGIRLPICALLFPGTKDVKESDLLKASKPLFEQDYSREDVLTFARINLLPIYRQRGHLRASFLDPVVKLRSDADCQNGVSVNLQVDEGEIYTWGNAEWTGNSVLTAQELSAALGMKPGERADGLKIDKGSVLISEAYGKRGYIEARVESAVPVFDDSNRRVSYRYNVTEGGQYRMGALEIKGLPEALTERIKLGWKLETSAAFDTSYDEAFVKKAMTELAAAGFAVQESKVEYKPNRDNRTVNVLITFK
ncbi:MAG TPA: POTRA domain-containing protein [Pyrinomonadaceae bacterium]|jgi:outer membrane protein insertion porin family